MRMRIEFAHAERKELALRCGDSGHERPLTCSNRHVSQLEDNSERCSENPWKGGERISTSARRGSRRRRQVKYHHTRQQRHPPVHSARGQSRPSWRWRWGTIVYFGSRAEAMPASKMPNLVSADAASSDAPDSADRARLRRPSSVPARPPAVSPSATCSITPALPVSYGSDRDTGPGVASRLISRRLATSSAPAPSTASRRAGSAASSAVASSPMPPAALAAEPAKTYGISR